MQITLEDLEGLKRKLNVTIPSDRIEGEVKSKLQDIATRAKMPGFRPGKVPFEVVKKNYGKSAHAEVIENLVRDTYPEAIQKESLRPAGPPSIEIISSDPDEHFVYAATFEVYPEIKLVDLEKIEIEKLDAKVEGDDIAEMLNKMRKSHITWNEETDSSRRAEEGDQLTIDFTVMPQDMTREPKTEKDVKFALGEDQMWDEFEKALYGAMSGEEKSYTLDMPETHMDKELAGNKVDFKVKVHKVKEPILPELNDEFAKKMNIKEGGIEKLKDEVRTHMDRELEQKLKELFKQTIMNKLLDQHVIEVPKVLVEYELDRLAKNWQNQFASQNKVVDKKPEFPRDQFEEKARRNVALGLLLSSIVKDENITVKPEEVRKKIEETVSAYYADKDDVLKKCLADKDYVREIEGVLLEEKVVDYLTTEVSIVDKFISYKEAMEKK